MRASTYNGPGDISKPKSNEGKAELAEFLQSLNGLTPDEVHSNVVIRSMSPGAGLEEVRATLEDLVYDVSQQMRVVLGRPPTRKDIPLIGECYFSKLNSLVDPELMAGIERVRLKIENTQANEEKEKLPEGVEQLTPKQAKTLLKRRESRRSGSTSMEESADLGTGVTAVLMLANNPGAITAETAEKTLRQYLGYGIPVKDMKERFPDLQNFKGDVYLNVVFNYGVEVQVYGVQNGEMVFKLECLVHHSKGIYPTTRNGEKIQYS